MSTDSIALLRASYLFRELPEEMLVPVAQQLKFGEYLPDTAVFAQGDPGDALYLLAEGRVEIHKQLADGRRVVLTVLDAPAAFGEIALLEGGLRTAGVRVLASARLAELTREDFHRLMTEQPAFSLALARTMASRIIALSDQVAPAPELPPPPPMRAREAALPAGWSALADALNSRILKLNEALEPVWMLDTTLIHVFRPLQVCWPDAGRFVVLDGESGRVSCWNERAQLEWQLNSPGHAWRRLELVNAGDDLSLLLLDDDLEWRLPDGRLLWSAQAAGITSIRDFAVGPDGALWLLLPAGELLRCQPGQAGQDRRRLTGEPDCLAISPAGQLAAYEAHSHRLQLLGDGPAQLLSLDQSETAGFRIPTPVGIFWTDAERFCLYDRYRLQRFDRAGHWQQRGLLQALPQLHNLAPVATFMARARREEPLQSAQRLRLNELLARVPLFAQLPAQLLEALGRRIRILVFNRGDLIVRQGEAGDSLYLIQQGQTQVLDENQIDVVATMGPGNLFGEVSLMLDQPRTATIRAASYSELLCLQRRDLDALKQDWPVLGERLLQLARERQTQQQLRSELPQRLEVRTPQPQADAESPAAGQDLMPLALWARDAEHGQLALIDRDGRLLRLLDDEVGLMQPVAALETTAGLWVLDPGLAELQLLDPDSYRLQRCFQGWGPHALDQPWDLLPALDGGLWLLNAGKGELLHLSAAGELQQVLQLGLFPTSMQQLGNGHLLISDLRQHTVSEYTPEGQEVWRYGSPRRYGRDENRLFAPEYAERLSNGHVLIADTGNSRVLEIALDGRIVWSLISATGLTLQRPSRCRRLSDGHTLIEHNRRRGWVEVDQHQLPVWQYAVPEQGWA